MTITTSTNRVDFAGNDITTAFATGFKFYAETDLTVILVTDSTGAEATQVLTTDYTVTGTGLDAGGTVTMNTAPATGETLVIIRSQGYTQTLDLVENDAFPSESVEEQLDRTVVMALQLLDKIGRSVQLPDGFTDTFDTTLPADLDTASAAIVVNDAADGFEMKTLVALDALGLPLSFGNGGTGASYANLAALLAGWGMEIGTDIQAYDADTAKTDVANTWTANQTFADNQVIRALLKDTAEAVNAIGAIGGGTQDIDYTLGQCVTATVDTSTTTFTFSNPPASGRKGSFELHLTNGGSQTVNWPASVDWAGATAPTLTSSGVDVLVFVTTDGGTTWLGFTAGLDMS
jgi:hypothetical protein